MEVPERYSARGLATSFEPAECLERLDWHSPLSQKEGFPPTRAYGSPGPSFCRFCLPFFRPQLGALRSCSALGGLEHAPASLQEGKGPGEAIIKAGSRDFRLRARTRCLNFGRGMDEIHWNRHCEKPWVKNQHVSWCCI